MTQNNKPQYTIAYRYNDRTIVIPCNTMKQAWNEMLKLLNLRDNGKNIEPTMHEVSDKW